MSSHRPYSATSRAPAIDTSQLVAGNNAFGHELYGQFSSNGGNLFLSPFIVSSAFGLLSAGASGKTLEEMENVLRLPPNRHAAFRAIIESLNDEANQRRPAYTLRTANALWAQKGYPWKPEYKKLAGESYAAGLFDADFERDAERTRNTINAWVANETRGKIQDVLPPGTIPRDTRLILATAIYFQGAWDKPFRKENTENLPFTRTDGTQANAPLMYRAGGYEYGEGDGFQVLDLPYTGKRISMTVILPRRPDGLPAVEKALTPSKLTTILGNLQFESTVLVHLPKFKIESSFALSQPLIALGMREAFTDNADFSGAHFGTGKLFITLAVHKAFVNVNEEGTEAAAGGGGGGCRLPPPPKEFKADRPFLFLIRDQHTKTTLFMGRIETPRA